jgi:hypothetical protein
VSGEGVKLAHEIRAKVGRTRYRWRRRAATDWNLGLGSTSLVRPWKEGRFGPVEVKLWVRGTSNPSPDPVKAAMYRVVGRIHQHLREAERELRRRPTAAIYGDLFDLEDCASEVTMTPDRVPRRYPKDPVSGCRLDSRRKRKR